MNQTFAAPGRARIAVPVAVVALLLGLALAQANQPEDLTRLPAPTTMNMVP